MKTIKLGVLAALLVGCLLLIPTLRSFSILTTEYFLGHALNHGFWEAGLTHLALELIVFGVIMFLHAFKLFANHFYGIAIGTILLFFCLVFTFYISPIPITDDAKNFLDFAVAYKHAPSFYVVLKLLFSSSGEYSLLLPHLAVILSMLIFGKVSFLFLLSLGFCFLLLLLLILRQAFEFDLKSLCLVLFFCHCAYYDALFWAASAWTILVTTLLVGLVLVCISKTQLIWRLITFFFACAASFTAPYGILAFVLSFFYCIYLKRWWSAFLWMLSSFLIGFMCISLPLPFKTAVYTGNYFLFSCIFLGSALQFGHSWFFPSLLGFCLWMLLGLVFVKGIYQKKPLLTGLVMYVLACSLMASVFRMHRGMDLALSNRYVFFSLLILVCYLLLFWDSLQMLVGMRLGKVLLGLLLAYHLAAGLFFFPELPLRKAKLAQYAKDLRSNKPFVSIKPLVTANTHDKVLIAIEEGVWEAE